MSTRRNAVRALGLSLSIALPIMNGCGADDPANEPVALASESIVAAGEACGSAHGIPGVGDPRDLGPYYATGADPCSPNDADPYYMTDSYSPDDADAYYETDSAPYYPGYDPGSYSHGYDPGSFNHGYDPGSYNHGYDSGPYYPGPHNAGPYHRGNPGPFPPGPASAPSVFACQGSAGPSALVVRRDGSCFRVPQPSAVASQTYCHAGGCLPCWRLAHEVLDCTLQH